MACHCLVRFFICSSPEPLCKPVGGDLLRMLRPGAAAAHRREVTRQVQGQAGTSVVGWGPAGLVARQRPGWDRAGDKHISSPAQAGAGGPGLSWKEAPGPSGRACGYRPWEMGASRPICATRMLTVPRAALTWPPFYLSHASIGNLAWRDGSNLHHTMSAEFPTLIAQCRGCISVQPFIF